MILLIDTSIWVDHLNKPDPLLTDVLVNKGVCMHPLILGELAMGNLRDRDELASLDRLPRAGVASNSEVRYAVDRHRLFGTGMTFIDAHLLVSTLITPDCFMHTRDKRLAEAASRLQVLAVPL